MNETGQRMLDGSKEPKARQVSAWLGPINYKRWKNILQFIATNYSGVFTPDSLRSQFGGKKHGWGFYHGHTPVTDHANIVDALRAGARLCF